MLRVGQQPREFCRSSNSQCASQSGRRCCGWDSSRESFVVLLIASVPAQVVGEVAGGTAGGVGSGAVFGMDSAAGSSDSANKAAPTKQSILSYGGLTVCLISCQAVAVLHPPPLPLAGVSTAMERGRQQHGSTLANGCGHHSPTSSGRCGMYSNRPQPVIPQPNCAPGGSACCYWNH